MIADAEQNRSLRFTVVLVIDRPNPVPLKRSIESVLAQDFTGWELLLAEVGVLEPAVRDVLGSAQSDPRVLLVDAGPSNTDVVRSVADAANAAITQARGSFVAFLESGDLLDRSALGRIAALLDDRPTADLVYTDEAELSPDGTIFDPFHKPDFSPERLRGQQYVGQLAAYRGDLLRQIGGVREGFGAAADHDLILRFSEQAAEIVHLPAVLYLRRQLSPAQSDQDAIAVKSDAARRALTDHLERTGIAGTVEQISDAGLYRVHRKLAEYPLISIVIPSRGSSAPVRDGSRCLVVEAVRSVLDRSSYPNFEVLVVLDSVAGAAVTAALSDCGSDRVRILDWTEPFNFSAKINRGVLAATGEFVVLLNDDVELITPDWLEVLLGLASQDDVGMVGAMLLFEDGTIQHAGQAMCHGGAGHIGYKLPGLSSGPYDAFLLDREVGGVTAACAMVRRSVFLEVGGLSLDLPVNFNDVDFGQKLRDAGKRIVWTPHAKLYHYESKTRVATVASYEIDTLNNRWGAFLVNDPYWHHVEAVGTPGE